MKENFAADRILIFPKEQLPFRKRLKNPAQVPGIKPQVFRYAFRAGSHPMGHFVKYARLYQGIRRFREALLRVPIVFV